MNGLPHAVEQVSNAFTAAGSAAAGFAGGFAGAHALVQYTKTRKSTARAYSISIATFRYLASVIAILTHPAGSYVYSSLIIRVGGQMRLSCRFRGQILDHRPGRAGRRPPSASMARAMRAAGLWNPKAIRVMTLILVFTDSIRPLLSP